MVEKECFVQNLSSRAYKEPLPQHCPSNLLSDSCFEEHQREIETIVSTSSQYFKNLTSLQCEAHLKILAVFYNLEKELT